MQSSQNPFSPGPLPAKQCRNLTGAHDKGDIAYVKVGAFFPSTPYGRRGSPLTHKMSRDGRGDARLGYAIPDKVDLRPPQA